MELHLQPAKARELKRIFRVKPLAAFEALWRDGHDIALVIAGNRGWMTGDLCDRLETHPQSGRRLHWLRKPSDTDLAHLYAGATGLLAASLGEGFGLPLVEAARAGVPILARDIPVFREVTHGHAAWFSGTAAEPLAAAIDGFITARRAGATADPRAIPTLSWDESASALRRYAVGSDWPLCWTPPASDSR